MDFKYKIADVAKEFGVPAKKVIETVTGVTGEAYKTGGTFEEKELNVLLETLTRENAEASLDAYLASGKEEAKPAPKPNRRSLSPRRPTSPPQRRSSPSPPPSKSRSPSRRKTAASTKSRPRSALKSASPCRSWPPIPALKSLSRPSRSRSTACRSPLTPAPSMSISNGCGKRSKTMRAGQSQQSGASVINLS